VTAVPPGHRVCACGLNLDIWQNSWNHRAGCLMQPIPPGPRDDRERLLLADAVHIAQCCDPDADPTCQKTLDALMPVVDAIAEARAVAALARRRCPLGVPRSTCCGLPGACGDC